MNTETSPASARVKAGDVVAEKYVVERVLAEGGMGVVVSARHKQLQRRVALKFLLPELCRKDEVVARFLREAQAMTTIQNEHVARVLDVGTTSDGSPYMVMEYLEGEDLSNALGRRRQLPVDEAIEYTLQAMEALAEAHLHGFVHRDLKPSNLFVTKRPDGAPLVKVLDFGISKIVAQASDGLDTSLTQAHGLLGSPLYMAPEQIRSSKTVDARADVWALGIILYELIAGRTPFEGPNVAAVLAAIIGDDPTPLRLAASSVSDELSAVIDRCLKRNRDERYASIGALATALRPFAPREGQLSIERIERVAAHHLRISTPVDLKIDTPPKEVSLEQTLPAPPAEPGSSAPRLQLSPASTTRDPGSDPKPGAPDAEGTFGKYKLIAVLGQGGMADVFLAVLGGPEGLGFSKLVVIKRLRGNLAHDPDFVAMLVDEARIAAKLNHPNVVQTHEVGVIDHEYYIAMEYLDGQPLNRIVQRVRSSPSAATGIPFAFRLGIVRDMLAGLQHAHELADFDGAPLGLVHRDVSPQNVFVTYEGQVKVVDFGIAKARGRAVETQQGLIKGKVAYMAPEQAGGQELDRRADIFAAGVVLWELLTGQRMWTGVEDVAIVQRLMLDKIPSSARTVNPDVPKALDAIVKKALARKKGDRYESAQAFQLELERYMEAEGIKCGARELGEWVGALFQDRRKQARSLIDSQLSALRSASPRAPRALDMSESRGGQTPSTRHLARLDREPIPADIGSLSEPVMARSNPGSTSASSTWMTRTRSRLVILAGAALVVTIVVIGVASQSRTPAAEGARLVSSTELTAVPPPASAFTATASSAAPVPSETAAVAAHPPVEPSASAAPAPISSAPRAPAVTRDPKRPPPVASASHAPPALTTTAASGRKRREIDNDSPYSAADGGAR